MAESFPSKILRHIANKDIDPQTLKRGVEAVVDLIKDINHPKGILRFKQTLDSYLGVPDLNVTDYSNPDYAWNKSLLRIYDFPLLSRIKLCVTNEDDLTHTQAFMQCSTEAVATFTGPTFKNYGEHSLPNNGFHVDGLDTEIKFCDTNPPGQRRGAFGFDDSGIIKLMTDEEKWEVINRKFKGYKALVGTPSYLLGSDSFDSTEKQNAFLRSILSYLMQYRNSSGEQRTCFALSGHRVHLFKSDVKAVLDDYMERTGGEDYIALEMEYNNASCLVRSPENKIERYGGVGFLRRDHYLVTLDSKQ